MVVISESRHPQSLDFKNERKVVILRDSIRVGKKMAWNEICQKVVNLQGNHPSKFLVRKIYREFNRRIGRRVYKYKNCGLRKWKVTQRVEKFIIRRLLALRKNNICTASMLAREVMAKLHVELDDSTVRKVIRRNGYKWLRRCQKRKYDPVMMAKRLSFVGPYTELPPAARRRKLSLAVDGVVVVIPPRKLIDRENFCHYGNTHMYRKPNEAASADLAGDSGEYAKQAPPSRCIPFWGAISADGFKEIAMHEQRKLTTEEWTDVLDAGKLEDVCKKLNPATPDGPWSMLCDGESFLHTSESRRYYRANRIRVWQIPAKSPDLNPIEKFWAWMRRRLRAFDMADLKAGRVVPGKSAYKQRLRNLLRSARAQEVAANCARGLYKVCVEVENKHGASSRG